MADVPEEVCVFCKEGEEAGALRNTSDEDILAHYNCLLFSPGVITRPLQDSQDTVEFDIPSVISEINRGKKLNCSYCTKKGATVGCNNKRCRKTYHYLCVKKDAGIHIRNEDDEQYIAYCSKHAEKGQTAQDKRLNNGIGTSGTFIASACSNKARKGKTLKRKKKEMEHNTARKKLRFDGTLNPGTVQNAEMRHDSDNRTNEEDMDVPGLSRTCLLHIDFYIRSDSGSDVESTESNASHSPQIRAEQNPGQREESEGMHMLSDHTYHEQMKALEPSTPLQQHQPTIVIGSDTETEDELPVFNGSQLVNIKGEGTLTKDDTSVADTQSRLLQETLPSPARERSSSISTDSSGSCIPEISRSLSLSGFPQKKKRKRKRNNPELETALPNMPPEERNAYSQLYDEVGGSLDISTCNDCDNEQMADASNETVEDIPKDQHTGTYAKSDGSNLKISLESSVLTRTPGQPASSTPVHDAPSVSQLPRDSPGVTRSPSQKCINVTNKVKNTDSLQGTIFHQANVASVSGEMLTSVDGENNARAKLKDICNGKDKLVSSSAVYHNPEKPLVDQPLSFSSTNKTLGKEQLLKSTNDNISSEQHNIDANNNDVVLESLVKTLKKPEEQHFFRHAPNKTLGPANIDILSDTEPLGSSSVSKSKTSNEQPMNLQFTSRSSEDQCKPSPGFSKSSGEQSTRNILTTKVLVHTVNSHGSDVPVEQTATVLNRQSQSVAHLSAITTGNYLLIGQPSCSSLVNIKCTEMSASFPRVKEAFIVKESLTKEASTSKEEAPPTSPGIKESGVQNETFHPSPLHIKAFSDQLRRGDFCKNFKNITVQFPGTEKSVVTSLSKLQSKEGGATSEQTSEHGIVSQRTRKYLSNVDGNLRNSGQTADEPASPGDLPEDGHMVVEEITHTDEDTVLPYGQKTNAPASPGHPPEDECMLVDEKAHSDDDTVLLYGKTSDKPASSNLQKNGCMPVEEITHADEDTVLLYGQTTDAPASPGHSPEDECMLVEEKAHLDDDTVLLYGQTSDKPASLSDLKENGRMLVEEVTRADEDTVFLSGKTSDKPASPSDLEENECMLVEEITHTHEDTVLLSDTTNVAALTANSSQTEISSGFPANVDKLMNLSIDQKNKLMEIYKEAEKQMSGTGDTTKAAQAFWDLCRENKCREFLLTLAMCYMKSVFHRIVHEEPKDREFEQAFSFLQASGCFADFINGAEDNQGMNNSRMTRRETYNESDSDSAEVEDQGEITRDEDPDGMGSESLESSQISNKVGQCTRDKDHNKVETEWSKTSSLSVNRKVEKSYREEDNSGMQSESSESSLESNRKEKSSRGEDHDVQSESCESSLESNRKEESFRGEDHDVQSESCESSLESNRKEESFRGEDNNLQSELCESCSESSRKEECCRDEDHDDLQSELSGSSLEYNRKAESSRSEDHGDIQSELCESCSQCSRKAESCRGEGYDDIQSELCKSSSERSRKKQSTGGEDLDRMETESPAASLFSPSTSSKSDLVLPQDTSRRHRALEEIQLKTMKTNLRVLKVQLQNLEYQMQQQPEDGDAGFATNLIQFLRKVPEDKKLSTQMSILKVLSSVLEQQPITISNPGSVSQQHTNPSPPQLSGQTLPPKPLP